MSSYNGSKYIRDQIQSILDQTGVDVHLFIRDDGSSDNTVPIIQSFGSERITVIEGKNIGAKKSFIEALALAPKAQYYAFSDQDDVWDHDKLVRAVDLIKQQEGCKPCLYCGKTRQVHADLSPINLPDKPFPKPNKFLRGELVSSAGCTMVFNAKLKDLINLYRPNVFPMHDAWVHFVCLAVGGVQVFDNHASVRYRQHENNVVGGKRNVLRSVIRQREFYKNMGDNYHQKMFLEIMQAYHDYMPEENYKRCKMICEYNDNLYNKIALLKDRDFFHGRVRYRLLQIWLVFFGKY